MEDNKFLIKGTILCKCGGTIISYTGKVMFNFEENKLYCWNCLKKYDPDIVFLKREKDKTIILET